MNVKRITQLGKRLLRVGVLVLLAALIVAPNSAASTSSASPMEFMAAGREASASGNGNTIAIGVAADLSSSTEFIGWRQINAVQLAVDQVNAGGGVDIGGTKYTIALVSADSGCNPTQAVTTANTLLNAGVVAMIGHTCTGASMAAQPLYAADGVSMIIPSSTAPQLTEQGYATTFRVITRDDVPPAILAAYLRSQLHHERAAIVEMDGFWGNWVGDAFANAFTSLGGTITSHHTISSTADLTAALTAIMAENPDAIHFAHDDGNTAGLLSQVAHDLGMANVAIAWTTYTENRGLLNDYANTAGVAAAGDIATMYHRATGDMSGYAALNADYVAAGFANHGDEAQMWGAFAYDAAQIIIAAIDRADSINPSAIRDEIAATSNYPGVVGTYEGFDNKGDVIPQWAWLEQYQNGRWIVIWPCKVFLPVALKQ